jgi:hypothetical protein
VDECEEISTDPARLGSDHSLHGVGGDCSVDGVAAETIDVYRCTG